MENIHSTFTKKDLTKIITQRNIPIDCHAPRKNICKDLLPYIQENNLQYLFEPNIFKKLSIKEKDEVILIAKKLKSYVSCGLDNTKSLYNSTDDAIADAVYIAQHGDISSVRKAVQLLNESLNINIKLTISENVQKMLEEKKKIKKDSVARFQIKKGKYFVEF